MRVGFQKRKGRAYAYRRDIPADLREKFGQSVYAVSLDTMDEPEAIRRYEEVHAEFERKLALHRAGIVPEPEVNDFVIVGMFVHDCMRKLEDGEDPAELLHLWLVEQWDDENALVQSVSSKGPRAEKIIAATQAILRGMCMRAARNGDPGRSARHVESMGDLAKRWGDQPAQARRKKTVYQYGQSAKAWDRWYEGRFNQTSVAASIRRANVNEFVKSLMKAGKAKATINRELAGLRTIYRFGELSDSNPFDRVSARMEINGPVRRRVEFKPDQARTLMDAAEQGGDENLHRALLIGFYSGMRIEEIAVLQVRDVVRDEGVWLFDLTRVDVERKSDSSHRQIPIHDKIVKPVLGWIKDRRPEEYVLQGEPEDQFGDRSRRLSKAGNRLVDRTVGEQKELVIHSTRHAFLTRMKHAGVRKEIREVIAGHAGQDVQDGYAHGAALKQKLKAVNAVKY